MLGFSVIAKRCALDCECDMDLHQESPTRLNYVAELAIKRSGVALAQYRQRGKRDESEHHQAEGKLPSPCVPAYGRIAFHMRGVARVGIVSGNLESSACLTSNTRRVAGQPVLRPVICGGPGVR